MASIPLPALDVRPPQQPDIAGNMQRLVMMKGMLQNQQLQGVQLQEANENLAARKALNDAFASSTTKDADGNVTFDQGKLQSALASGPAAYKTPEVLEGITKFQKTKVDLQNAVQDLHSKTTDMIGGAASAVQAANYDPVLAHSLLGSLPPSPEINQIKQKIDGDPAAFKQLIDGAVAQSPKAAEMAKNRAQAAQNRYKVVNGVLMDVSGQNPVPANGQNLNKQDWLNLVDNTVPPSGANAALNTRTKQQVSFYVGTGNLEAAQKAITEASQQLGSLEKEKVTQAHEDYRQALNRQAMFSNELQKNGLGQLDKMFTDPQHGYTQFLSQAQATKQAAIDARNGSQLAASLTPLMTALGVTSYAGIHRINETEVNSAGKNVGSIYRHLNSILDKAGSGTIPPETAKEVGQLIDTLIDAKHSSLVQGASLVARNNGLDPTKTSVMTREGTIDTLDHVSKLNPPSTQQNAGSSAPPPGATHTAKGSDGKIHWTDDTGTKDYGVKE